MAYTYTLTNEGQFKAEAFQENILSIQLKNNGTVECDEIIEGFFNKTLPDDSYWIKIFYHNVSAGLFVKSNKQYLTVEDIKTESLDKYSRLAELDSLPIYESESGKYEFLLEFPTDLPGLYNRWSQENNPFKVKASNKGVTNYEAKHEDFVSNYWNGLEYNGYGPCLADGSSRDDSLSLPVNNPTGHENWFYAIGCSSWHTDNGKTGIPGPNGKAYSDIALWVRVENPTDYDRSFYLGKNNKIYCNEFIEE